MLCSAGLYGHADRQGRLRPSRHAGEERREGTVRSVVVGGGAGCVVAALAPPTSLGFCRYVIGLLPYLLLTTDGDGLLTIAYCC